MPEKYNKEKVRTIMPRIIHSGNPDNTVSLNIMTGFGAPDMRMHVPVKMFSGPPQRTAEGSRIRNL